MTIELHHIMTGMATTLDTPAAVGRFLAHRSPDEWEGWSHLHAAPDFKAAFEAAADEEPQELPVDAQVAAATDALQQAVTDANHGDPNAQFPNEPVLSASPEGVLVEGAGVVSQDHIDAVKADAAAPVGNQG